MWSIQNFSHFKSLLFINMTLLIIFLIIVAVAFTVWLISRRRSAEQSFDKQAKPESLAVARDLRPLVAPTASPLPQTPPVPPPTPVPASPTGGSPTPPPPESPQSNNFTI